VGFAGWVAKPRRRGRARGGTLACVEIKGKGGRRQVEIASRLMIVFRGPFYSGCASLATNNDAMFEKKGGGEAREGHCSV